MITVNNTEDDYQEMKFEHLSEAQQSEILARDEEYKSGKADVYSMEEVIAYFGLTDRIQI